jgi:hypothetical protein
MPTREGDSIHFEIRFEDGSTALISLDQTTLRHGDGGVFLIVEERKRKGLLPLKPIASIRRLN